MRVGYISNFEDLYNWFMERESPKFTVFHGTSPKGRRYFLRQQEDIEMEEAYRILHDNLSRVAPAGGIYTIQLQNMGQGHGDTVCFSLTQSQGQANSINGLPSIAGKTPQQYIEESIRTQIRIYDLERQIEDLHAQQDAKTGIGERILNGIINHPKLDPNTIMMVMGNLINQLSASLTPAAKKAANVGVSGFPDNAQQMVETQQRLAAALEKISGHFPNYVEMLENLAVALDKNPALKSTIETVLIVPKNEDE